MGTRSSCAQCASRSRCTSGGPFSTRLSCACVIPNHPATTVCGKATRPWYGWHRYALITRPRCRSASASRTGSCSQKLAGTAGGALSRSRSAAWHGAHRPLSLSRASRPPHRGQFAWCHRRLRHRGRLIQSSVSIEHAACRSWYTRDAYRKDRPYSCDRSAGLFRTARRPQRLDDHAPTPRPVHRVQRLPVGHDHAGSAQHRQVTCIRRMRGQLRLGVRKRDDRQPRAQRLVEDAQRQRVVDAQTPTSSPC